MESLPDDVLQDILEQCPDYATLSTATLLCKRLHDIAEQHPKSIAKAVATNLIGPALPQAMRVVRYRQMMSSASDTEEDGDEEECEIPATVDMDAVQETIEEGLLSIEEKQTITRLSDTLKTLEDAFSWKHRDRKSHTSVLSNLESFRFRKALLRVTLYCAIFSPHYLEVVYERSEYEEEMGTFVMGSSTITIALDKYFKATREFFGSFVSQDLLEMLPVAEFLSDLGFWIRLPRPFGGMHALPGPLTIASEFRSRLASSRAAEILGEYLSIEGDWNDFDMTAAQAVTPPDALSEDEYLTSVILFVLEQRQGVKVPAERSGLHTVRGLELILDPIDAAPEECAHCHASDTFLWNCDNWDYASGYKAFNVLELAAYLPGKLSRADSVMYELHLEYEDLFNTDPRVFPALMLDLLDSSRGLIQAEWEGLCAEDLLCDQCLVKFLKDHLYLLLRNKQVLRGDRLLEDCWWGYNCRTMVHKPAHEEKLNHLCPQTRFA
ncbi:hypothetical protein CYLTODRAFT_426059 [Cylindrobasidium torrendii FP15055 ss-10]|uniref:F-box domain-containing protein n=1 Tax=Cylindrobasidium torrendii FP15055 ss-10 TaxID=1314674 RepID=A0A0D7B1U8_9AGAR|nr:hypothetical protein CYLTODRAFT_426059 [Cylindrobasidium torrendii FP15055 ss-10]